MLGIAKRSSHAPYRSSQTVKRGLVGGIAPQQRRQFPARLATIWAEREIGKQRALALSERCHSLVVEEQPKLEAAKQAKRPARSPFTPFARSWSRIHPTLHKATSGGRRRVKPALWQL